MAAKHTIRLSQVFLAILFASIIFFVISLLLVIQKTNEESKNVRAAISVILTQDTIKSQLQLLDSAKRDFVATGSQIYLTNFYNLKTNIRRKATELNNINLNEDTLNTKKNELYDRVIYLINNSTSIINHRLNSPEDSLLIDQMQGVSEVQTANIYKLAKGLDGRNKNYLYNSNFKKKRNVYRIFWLFIATGILVSAVLFIYYRRIILAFRTQKVSDNLLRYNASLIGNISDPIITTNNVYQITNWNKYAEQLFGYTEEEVLDKRFAVALSIDTKELYYANNFNSNPEKYHWQQEFVHRHKDGHLIYTQISASTVNDFDGKQIGTVAVIRDISQHKKMQFQLQDLSDNLQVQVNEKVIELSSIFERITDAFFALDNNWNYSYVNEKAASLHNRTVEELLGKNIWEENPQILNEPFAHALHKAKSSQLSQNLELYYSKTGQWFQDLIYPSYNGISVYYHDITDKKQAELSILKVNQKLNFHINNTPLAVIEFDVGMNILQWSAKSEEIFGWQADEALGKNIFQLDLVHPEDQELVYNILSSIPNAEDNYNTLHYRSLRKDGIIIYCEWHNSVLRNSADEVIGVMSLIQDITIRKKVELELLEAESKFRSLVEKSMVGVYIIQNNKITYSNPRQQQIFGYDENEYVSDFLELIVEEDRNKVIKNFQNSLLGTVPSIRYTIRGKHKDGHIIDLDVFGSSTMFQGEPAVIGTLVDITDSRKLLKQTQQSEEALKISNERFELVTKATNEAIMDWNVNNNSIWGNEAYQKIFMEEEVAPFDFGIFLSKLHKDDEISFREIFMDALMKNETSIEASFRFKNLHPDYLVLEVKAYLLYNDAGRVYRVLGAIRDVTEETKYQQRIELAKSLSDNIINSLPGLFYLFNSKGQYYRWNKNLESITGYTGDEILNNSPLLFFKPEDQGYLTEKISAVFEYGSSEMEADLVTKSGETIPYYFNGVQIDYEGETCLVGTGIDISERVKSQLQLKESEEKFRSLVEQAADGIYTTDRKGLIKNVNSRMAGITGYSVEELLTMDILDILVISDPASYFDFYNEDLIEFEARKKDGSIINIEINAKKLSDDYYQGVLRDITERRKVEEELKNSAIKYRLLFNENPMPMFMLDLPGEHFIDVNNAAIKFYGYDKNEFLKMSMADLKPKLMLETSIDINRNSYWLHSKRDGQLASLNIISHHIIYEDKPVKLILAQDISETKLAENKLKNSHEQLRQLAMHMEKLREAERTHMAREIHDELGQQLTGLKMDISWLNKKIQTEDEAIKSKLKDTISLIDKTVITVRKIATDLRPSILDDLGLIAAMEWQSEEFQKRSEITTNFNSNVSQINIPAELATGLFRIYQESLTNILRHAEAVEVNSYLRLKDNNIELIIKDNGKGFTMENIESKKTLGLLGMKERITLLGGSYEINSIPGNGTNIIINLPLPE